MLNISTMGILKGNVSPETPRRGETSTQGRVRVVHTNPLGGTYSAYCRLGDNDNEMNLNYKAALVGCGYSLIKFRDYAYAPTLATLIILLVMHIASNQKMHIETFDVSNDYTNYAWLPAAFFGRRVRVVLKKALHGENHAGKS